MGRVILRVGGTLARYYISEHYLTNGMYDARQATCSDIIIWVFPHQQL